MKIAATIILLLVTAACFAQRDTSRYSCITGRALYQYEVPFAGTYDSTYKSRVHCMLTLKHKSICYVTTSFTAFGTLVFGSALTNTQKLHAAKSYVPGGVYRSNLTLSTGGIDGNFNRIRDSGFMVSEIIRDSDAVTPVFFATNEGYYKHKLGISAALYTSRIFLHVIEDEPTNKSNYYINIGHYLRQMKWSGEVIHPLGGKITDGGIHTEGVSYLVFYDLLDSGKVAEAAAWKDLCFSAEMKNYVNNPAAHADITLYINQVDSILRYSKENGSDFQNIHLKWPFNGVQSDTAQVEHLLTVCVDFMRKRSGNDVVSNETGFKNNAGSAGLLRAILRTMLQLKITYTGWFDENNAGQGLTASGVLTAYGAIFKQVKIDYDATH